MKSLALFFVAVALFAGCRPAATQPTRPQSSLAGRADRGTSLLTAAANQLNNFPDFVDLAVRTPLVVFDSRKSSDEKDILATCKSNPAVPDSPINVISVPAGNGRFKSARIRPGDIVKYYVRLDTTLDEESIKAGLGRQLAIDLTVAQVLNDNVLLVEESLNAPVEIPAKLEIWRFLDDRIVEIGERLKTYSERRLPPLGWEPSPDEKALTQIVDWLNQWSRQSQPAAKYRVDPLLSTLDTSLLKDEQLGPRLTNAALSADELEPHEGRLLQEAIWSRDISRWAQGEKFDNLSRAEALFDWTVRNIQLENDADTIPHRPWQTLLYGHGTANERAWVFAMLCRQQSLDVVLLTPAMIGGAAEAAKESSTAGTAERLVLPAVLSGGQLYVFDARLGLPLRGADGRVATLEQLRADDGLLRRYDLPDMAYPLTAKKLSQMTVNVVADPFDLSRAAFQLERKLTGENRVVLTANASDLAGRVKSVAGASDVRLWDVPFKTLRDQLNFGKAARLNEAVAFEPFAWRPALWKARVLHFQGRRRPAGESRGTTADEATEGHAAATQLYSSKEVRPSPRDLGWSSPDKQRVAAVIQKDAAYWVGLLLFDDRKYDVATQWFSRPELTQADSPWAAGAKYNLARTWEALGKQNEAIKLYEADTSPQRQGNHVRANWLRTPTGAQEGK